MSGRRGFEVIGEREVEAPQGEAQADLTRANTQMLMLALRALSQRALTAITNLFTVILVGSVWWLCSIVLPDPKPLQLIGVGGYAAFCLMIDIVRRRR